MGEETAGEEGEEELILGEEELFLLGGLGWGLSSLIGGGESERERVCVCVWIWRGPLPVCGKNLRNFMRLMWWGVEGARKTEGRYVYFPDA